MFVYILIVAPIVPLKDLHMDIYDLASEFAYRPDFWKITLNGCIELFYNDDKQYTSNAKLLAIVTCSFATFVNRTELMIGTLIVPLKGSRGWGCLGSRHHYTFFLHGRKCARHYQDKKGKIRRARFGTIHIILQKTLQYLLSWILQSIWPIIHDIVRCKHAFYHMKL